MKRAISLFLLFVLGVALSGVGESLHERLEHSHAHAADDGKGVHLHAASAADDAAHCNVCHAMHAPFVPVDLAAFDVRAEAVVRAVLLLQSQRLDAAVVARIVCRGPPVV